MPIHFTKGVVHISEEEEKGLGGGISGYRRLLEKDKQILIDPYPMKNVGYGEPFVNSTMRYINSH